MNILKEKGEAVLLGNEAVARGALEAGVQFAATYPGTPSSEIGDSFSEIQSSEERFDNFYFEYSPNEKTALEAVIGASYSGLKSIVSMKHFGLNVASDSFMPFLYTGCNGPTVIVVADDPSCWSSGQSEQNTRAFARLAHVPILEPSDPKEAKEFVKRGFELSEQFNIPVMVRITTRVAHQRQVVPLRKINVPQPEAEFEKKFDQYVTMPPRVLELKAELLDKIKEIKKKSERSELNPIESINSHVSDLGIIVSGVSYNYVKEALEKLDLEVPVLKLGYFYPLPEQKIKNFIKDLEKVLVVEELEPYLEDKIKGLAKNNNSGLEILGKELLTSAKKNFSKELPSIVEELKPEYVIEALNEITDADHVVDKKQIETVKHIPRFCTDSGSGSGCPYWRLFAAVREAANKVEEEQELEIIYGGDIGCYMMGGLPHTEMQDYLLNMGSSVGISHGVQKALEQGGADQKVIAFIGDSTFFHAGMPALVNTVYNDSDPLIIVADNRITAMTGLQPNPGMQRTGMGQESPSIRIEDIAEAVGVENIAVVDEVEEFGKISDTVEEFLNKDEASVIVAKHPCWLNAQQKNG
ncbi:MAG: thiamine pyrophosphate-dependent enzyme [Candidatus Paceibacterota bacterium]